jgi:large subunit ribosomal protein L32
MAVPTQRHTKSKRQKRRMHIFLKPALLVKCQKCKKLILPHYACPYCGYYKGVEVIDVLRKLTKKERKQREREMKTREREDAEKGKSLSWEDLSKR